MSTLETLHLEITHLSLAGSLTFDLASPAPTVLGLHLTVASATSTWPSEGDSVFGVNIFLTGERVAPDSKQIMGNEHV